MSFVFIHTLKKKYNGICPNCYITWVYFKTDSISSCFIPINVAVLWVELIVCGCVKNLSIKMTFVPYFVLCYICFEDVPVDVTVPITAKRVVLYSTWTFCAVSLI